MAKQERRALGGQLGEHVFGTYISLRWGLAALSFAFPPSLYVLGRVFYGLPLQPSMSAYYFAADASMCSTFPMRTVFVGMMCAIALGLYLYKGFSRVENYLLNAAAISAIVVAACPERLDESQLRVCEGLRAVADAQQGQPPWHFIAAAAVVVLLGMVALFCSSQSLKWLPARHAHERARFVRAYRGIAAATVLLPVVGFWLFVQKADGWTFWVELLSCWSFAAYWIVKSLEMNLSEAEFRELTAADVS